MPISNAAVAMQPGTIAWFAASSAPAGFVKANGAALSRTAYAGLFAVIGTTYGAGDGSTTFNVPDLRGEFIRGFDDGRGVDSGRVFATSQGDQNQQHTHDILATGASNTGSTWRVGTVSVSSSTYTHISAAQSSGGTESRPRNIAMLACIKF